MNTLIEKLEKKSLNKNSQGKLARFLLELDSFENLTIKELTDQTGISVATATRLAKSVGLSGFVELKDELEIQNKKERVNEKDNVTLDEYKTIINESFIESFNPVNERKIDLLIGKINYANRIDFFSTRGQAVVVRTFANRVSSLDKEVTYYNEYYKQFFQAEKSSQSTVAIGISYVGAENETLECLKEAKKNGATTILITECEQCVQAIHPFIDETIGITVSSPRLYKRTLLPEIILVALLDVIYNKLLSLQSRMLDEK